MKDVWTDVASAVQSGDSERVATLCESLDEASRGTLASEAIALAEALGASTDPSPAQVAAQTAVVALGPVPAYLQWQRPDLDQLERVVRSRSRAWRNGWAEWAITRTYLDAVLTWQIIRRMVRDGLCDEPAVDERLVARVMYTVATLARGGSALADTIEPADVLRADLPVLESTVWESLKLERSAQRDWMFDEWDVVLIQLATEGLVDRDRLVDETIDALERYPAPAHAKRVIAFHDKLLAPSPDEMMARIDRYLAWLESDRDTLVGFALGNLLRVEAAGAALDPVVVLDHLGPVMGISAKTHARRAVALVGRVLAREPALTRDGVGLLLSSITHPARDVQVAAAKLLVRHAGALDGQAKVRLQTVAPALDPDARLALGDLVKLVAEPDDEGPACEIPRRPDLRPERVPRTLTSAALKPIADVEELLELASKILEGLDDPDEFERLVGALDRFPLALVAPGRRKALLRRIRRRGARGQLPAAVLECWLDPESAHAIGAWGGRSGAAKLRLRALSQRLLARQQGVLLCAATHRGGFLDGAVLARRLSESSVVDDADLAAALLRLPVFGREQSLETIAASGGEVGAIAELVLGRRTKVADGATLPASWDAASAICAPSSLELEPWPQRDDPRITPLWVPRPRPPEDAVSPARQLTHIDDVVTLFNPEGCAAERQLAYVWPTHRELYYAGALHAMDGHAAPWGGSPRVDLGRVEAALHTMLLPDEPLGDGASLLLAIGLQSPDVVRLLAVDVAVDAIATRRLDPEQLGRAIANSVEQAWTIPGKRLAASLGALPAFSALHAHETQRIIEAVLAHLDQSTRIPVGLVDLLRTLAQEANARVSDPQARAALARLSSRSMTGKRARTALDITANGARRSREAAAAAREADRERARRWAEAGPRAAGTPRD